MRIRKCPYCKDVWSGKGRGYVQYGFCGYCHGKRKVYSEYIQWEERRIKKKSQITNKIYKEFEDTITEKIKTALKKWEQKNPKPLKFPKKKPALKEIVNAD